MKIKELINEMEYEILAGSEETEITTLVYDSRKVENKINLLAVFFQLLRRAVNIILVDFFNFDVWSRAILPIADFFQIRA